MIEVEIPLHLIDPGDNDREHFDEQSIADLAMQIQELGLLQAIVVRTRGDRFQLIAGERRWRAHHLLGAKTIRATVRDDLSDADASLAMLVENDARVNLNPIEQGASYRRQIEEYDRSAEEIAAAIGRKPGYVRDRLNLLSLSQAVVSAVRSGALPHTTALRMVGLNGNRQRIALREYLQNPAMTAEQWQIRIEALRAEEARENQTELVPSEFTLEQETYEPVLVGKKAPNKVGLGRLLARVLAARDADEDWSAPLEAEIRAAVEGVVGDGAQARRAAAHKAWETMRKDKAG